MAEVGVANFRVRLTQQTAIVTGAGAGVGKAIALALADSGANVVVNDLNAERAESVADLISNSGIQAIDIQGDVSNRFQAASLIERARDIFGEINILINTAGVYKAEPLLNIDEWDWRRQLEINLTGTFFMSQLVGRVMADEGGGCIVNCTSTAGHPHAITEGAGYIASKTGVVGLTKQLAHELAPHQIRVNAICIGNVEDDDAPQITPIANALQRQGTPDEIASVALFLCSDAASFITGQAINVDGGEAML